MMTTDANRATEITQAGHDLHDTIHNFLREKGLRPAEGAVAIGIALTKLAYYQGKDGMELQAIELVLQSTKLFLPIFAKTDPNKSLRKTIQ